MVVYTIIISVCIIHRPVYIRIVPGREYTALGVCKNGMYKKNHRAVSNLHSLLYAGWFGWCTFYQIATLILIGSRYMDGYLLFSIALEECIVWPIKSNLLAPCIVTSVHCSLEIIVLVLLPSKMGSVFQCLCNSLFVCTRIVSILFFSQ